MITSPLLSVPKQKGREISPAFIISNKNKKAGVFSVYPRHSVDLFCYFRLSQKSTSPRADGLK
jgi:hypothetical protein